MSLTAAEFEGFDRNDAQDYLDSFLGRIRKRGEDYFRGSRVKSLVCQQPGRGYLATVLGSRLYDVTLTFDDMWDAECTCPELYECKHAYAAMRALLAHYESVGRQRVLFAPAPSRPTPAPAPEAPATGLAATLQEKLGRKLADDEAHYLKNLTKLFHKAANGGLRYQHELTGLGLPVSLGYWNQLELYPSVPKTLGEFWNCLALYLQDKAGQTIPEFMQPVTDLEPARAGLLRLYRSREVAQWQHTLTYLGQPVVSAVPAASKAEVRVRFSPDQIHFEWRVADASQADWTGFKPRKRDEFALRHAASLSPESTLLWLAYQHRMEGPGAYHSAFHYADTWVQEQVSRWFAQPFLHPLLVNQAGQPLVFHPEPLRWQITQPDTVGDDGDYLVALVQANGQPAPKWLLVTLEQPPRYLTVDGVFPGPPCERSLLPPTGVAKIPAPAFESTGGLRLLEHLQLPPPPRLASRVRTIKMRPGIRAEIKASWQAEGPEYCHLDVYAASEDGQHVEAWTAGAWTTVNTPADKPKKDELITFDRTSLAGLTPPLEAAGFKWEANFQRWQLRVTKKFAGVFVPFLQGLPAETRIELRGELASFQNTGVAGKIRLEATEDEMDWFNLRVIVDVNDTTLTREEIKLLLDAKGGWVRLGKNGWRKLEFTLTEQEDQELARLGLTPHELTSEPQRLHAFQLADQAARKFLPAETCERIERRAAELQARVTPDLPATIQAEMRPYQRDGFHFLAYLSTNRFGGILADDMGLGKTLQTLAWLAWLQTQAPANAAPADAARKPSLVVCPKSVADNWHSEAVKFFPTLKVRVWSASELSSVAGLLASADLHVLNYSQLRQVGEDLARERFQAVILDEGQYIKNPSSQTAQVARQLRAEHRLILSGTPIENRLLDLWSLMSFAMPGALGTRAEFGRLYDAKGDPFARQRLAARVRPFLIRRTKAQVAKDLPDRVEEDLFCELEGEQKTLYRAELKRAQAMLLGVKTAAALNKQRFNFLTSLLRLRQICCHPKLVKPDSKAASAKVEALFETIEPIIEEGQKVLVFSQFVELLNCLRTEAKARDWPHWYLAGDTEDRGALVADFQAAEGAGVFFISLKAGGFGLNLTAASYVVLFDPWWNPAVENQAIDRTHRIGQDRKVIAYRLLIKDSIEEKIRALQRQKSSLANDVLGEEKFSQGLSLDDLRFLLAG